eukprot:337520-Chlamydomonas_euryale.AAC.3
MASHPTCHWPVKAPPHFGPHLFEKAQEHIGREAALMRLVDHDDRVARQERVAEHLADEHAIRKVLDPRHALPQGMRSR